ncbi:Hypothetical protein LUCI_0459 [Lucifera butyrica]|uniref:Uncharacterized protein n=1 Tax=Lucifera butyrica TaxID=1351585 RepID=A0A498R4Q7_9FIRM|nr:hypothetical protein [Lucifera butyrica]VBB05252.1 Hypothetical protein LUCI_0459 [Lucifera butyrica]
MTTANILHYPAVTAGLPACVTDSEILDVRQTVSPAKPHNITGLFRFSFFIRILCGPAVRVYVQTSYNCKDWFLDSTIITLTPPPLLITDRVVLTADHYACFARVTAEMRGQPSKVLVVFQSQPYCCPVNGPH